MSIFKTEFMQSHGDLHQMLDVDNEIWQDIGLEDENIDPPRWLADETVHQGIHHLLDLDHCLEEEDRLRHEHCVMQEYMVAEWSVLQKACEVAMQPSVSSDDEGGNEDFTEGEDNEFMAEMEEAAYVNEYWVVDSDLDDLEYWDEDRKSKKWEFPQPIMEFPYYNVTYQCPKWAGKAIGIFPWTSPTIAPIIGLYPTRRWEIPAKRQHAAGKRGTRFYSADMELEHTDLKKLAINSWVGNWLETSWLDLATKDDYARTIYQLDDASMLERVGTPFEGHTNIVTQAGLALSFDGTLLALQSTDTRHTYGAKASPTIDMQPPIFADVFGVDDGKQPFVLFFCLGRFQKKEKKQDPMTVYDDELEDDEEEENVNVFDPVAAPPLVYTNLICSPNQFTNVVF
ncbi:hypothetical protein BDR04DRAFT_1141772 [Suillus decipiens]|nr:hypothetical protein BDR04DRAFT_1141772 [Suillus decipiens]